MSNPFDRDFNQVTDSFKQSENIRDQVIKALNDLNESKRTCNNRQHELAKSETAMVKLRQANQELKNSLLRALIEKESIAIARTSLSVSIDRLEHQIKSLEQESDSLLVNGNAERLYSLFSNQQSLSAKIQESKCQLMKCGLSPTEIAMLQMSNLSFGGS